MGDYFATNGSSWIKQGNTITSQTGSMSAGGVDISADGSRIVFGNTGYNESAEQVKVFDWNGTSWVKVGSNIQGAAQGDSFGAKVDGNLQAI